jgi:hypothetical protein
MHKTMKIARLNGQIFGALLLAGSGLLLEAQNYSIGWYKIAGGGGVSIGGVYSVSGTIGQNDATTQTLTGGPYSLAGGFWAFLGVVQTAGLPNLSISFVRPNSVMVSWPAGAYSLQQNSTLVGGTWTTSGYTVTTSNGTNSVTITPPVGSLFFRLKAP